MKYSFIIPYYHRPSFQITLSSMLHFYGGRSDWEVLVIEDSKDTQEDTDILVGILQKFPTLPVRRLWFDNSGAHTGVKIFNYGARESHGEFLILQNPECAHMSNILSGLDAEFSDGVEKHVVCAVLSVNFEGLVDTFQEFKPTPNIWYQHSVYNNRQYHFCAALPKDTYTRVGGFDEAYAKGVSYDDDDFVLTLKKNRVPIVSRDHLLAVHIEHPRPDQSHERNAVNLTYFKKKWGR